VETTKKMPRGNKRSKAAMQLIKEKVFQSILDSKSNVQAMKEIGIGTATFDRYQKEIFSDNKKKFISKSGAIIGGYVLRTQERTYRAKTLAKNSSDVSKEQLIDDSLTKRMQEVGALEKAPELIKQEVTVVTYGEPSWIKIEKDKKLKQKNLTVKTNEGNKW